MSSTSASVAIVTGACSGIGLALSQHLLAKGWHVVFADINPPPETVVLPPDAAKYIRCDVASWDSQAALFAQAHAWRNRLDFAALNAGIDDRDDIFDSLDPSTPPKKPNMLTFKVNLLGVYYGVKLAAHYMARNSAAVGRRGGDIIITASSAGLYALPSVPQYVATKHALVGLTRALAPKALPHAIYINALCPSMVPTNLAPPGLMDHFPDGARTPMSTMLRAYDELMDHGRNHWAGQIVEVAVDNLYFRDEIEAASKELEKTSKGAAEAWDKAYRERNVAFAKRDWEREKRERKASSRL